MSKAILYTMAWLHIIGGALLPFINQFDVAIDFVNSNLAGTAAQPGAVFWIGVFGPTVASWGVLFLCLLNIYFTQPSVAVWRSLLLAVLLWGLMDTSYCLLHDVPQALWTNIPALLLLLIPLLVVRPRRLGKVVLL